MELFPQTALEIAMNRPPIALIAFDARLSKEAVRVDLASDDYWSGQDWVKQAFLGTRVNKAAVKKTQAAYLVRTGLEIGATEIYHLFELISGDGGRYVKAAENSWIMCEPFNSALPHFQAVATATGFPLGCPRMTMSSPGYLAVGPTTNLKDMLACDGCGGHTAEEMWAEFRKFPDFPEGIERLYRGMHPVC